MKIVRRQHVERDWIRTFQNKRKFFLLIGSSLTRCQHFWWICRFNLKRHWCSGKLFTQMGLISGSQFQLRSHLFLLPEVTVSRSWSLSLLFGHRFSHDSWVFYEVLFEVDWSLLILCSFMLMNYLLNYFLTKSSCNKPFSLYSFERFRLSKCLVCL